MPKVISQDQSLGVCEWSMGRMDKAYPVEDGQLGQTMCGPAMCKQEQGLAHTCPGACALVQLCWTGSGLC